MSVNWDKKNTLRIDVQRKEGRKKKKKEAKVLEALETFFCVAFPLGFLLSPL